MAMLYFPAAQGVQSAVPVWSLYLPAVQAVQGPPSGPVKPALHVQSARVMLPGGGQTDEGQRGSAVRVQKRGNGYLHCRRRLEP